MAISQHRESSKLYGQNQFRSIDSGLWKMLAGAPFLAGAGRQPQRRAFFQLTSQLVKKNKNITNEFKMIPYYRHLSTSFVSSTNSSQKTGFLQWYLGKLKSNPIITKSVSASVIFTFADVSSQVITMPENGSFDLFRTARMSSYAFIITGSGQHFWFNSMSKIMPQKNIYTTISKIILGQTIFIPIMNAICLSYNAILRGENRYEIVARLKRDLLPTLKSSIVYWPFCDFMTYMFVPVHLQPVVTSSLAYLWIIYMSYMSSLVKVGSDERSERVFSKTISNHAI